MQIARDNYVNQLIHTGCYVHDLIVSTHILPGAAAVSSGKAVEEASGKDLKLARKTKGRGGGGGRD